MAQEQMSLDLGLPPQPEICYFALRPDAATARAIVEVARWCCERHGLSARLYGADRLHLSLAPAESRRGVRKGDVAAAIGAAAGVRSGRFAVTFDRICTFGGGVKRPVVLRCSEAIAGLNELRAKLHRELVKVGLRHGPAQFCPHVTLFWDRCRIPEAKLKEPIRWNVEEFVLVRSMIGRSRHIDLGRWLLKPGSASS